MYKIFGEKFKSVGPFEAVTLPDFCLLTGENGSGKSQLLEALRQGHLRSEDFGTGHTDIIHLNTSSIELREGPPSGVPEQVISITITYEEFESYLKRSGILEVIAEAGISDRTALNFVEGNAIYQGISMQFNDFLHQEAGVNVMSLVKLAGYFNKPIVSLSKDDFKQTIIPFYGEVIFFNQRLRSLFNLHRQLVNENDFKDFRYSRGKSRIPPLPIELIPEAPWDVLNRFLENYNFDFRFEIPSLESDASIEVRLVKLSDQSRVQLEELSSGETVMMAMILSIFYNDDKRQRIDKPKLILLDEIDAPLHPSLVRSLLEMIRNVFVKGMSCKVILTTHSPTTVALCNEGEIFTISPGKAPEATPKQMAINRLTAAVPTIAIDNNGRRYVLVESSNDQEIYEYLYDAIKDDIQSELSLQFIAVGHQEGGGCDNLKRMIKALEGSGNRSFVGVIDRDHGAKSEGRIYVLAENSRYAIENIVCDPIMLLAVISRDLRGCAEKFSLPYSPLKDLIKMPLSDLQRWVDQIVKLVLAAPDPSEATKEKFNTPNPVEVTYASGLKLAIDSQYLLLNGHKLARKVLEAFKELRALPEVGGKSADAVLRRITRTVVRDEPGFLPIEVSELFRRLLAHQFD